MARKRDFLKYLGFHTAVSTLIMQQPRQPEICACGVPYSNHGTACGWNSAKFSEMNGIICTPGHPFEGRHFNEWTAHLSAPASPLIELLENEISSALETPDGPYDMRYMEGRKAGLEWALGQVEKKAPASPVEEKPEDRGWDSLKIIGRVRDRFNELIEKGWDWRSFYSGWLEGRSDMLKTVNAQIGTLEEGQHPDEIYPRAITWLQERKNGIDEVERLRNHIAKLEGAASDQNAICGCGRILIPRLDPSGKKIGVTHETIEDEEHHSEYFSSLSAKPPASLPVAALIVDDKYRKALQDIADKVLQYDKLYGDNRAANHCRNIALQALGSVARHDLSPDAPIVGEREERKYPIGGYAPGNYYCNCVTCKENFQGDKRAVQCEPCATKIVEEAGGKDYAHIHMKLPNGSMATVSPDASPELLNALTKMVDLAKAMPDAPKGQAVPEGWDRWMIKKYDIAQDELDAYRKALASARTLILNIKRGNIYQEPADECDKWLNSNPEIK